jgi:antirestriction protein ArdC
MKNQAKVEETNELKKKAFGYITDLAELTDNAKKSETFTAWLQTLTLFHKYSLRNQFMIYLQKPSATYVAGYNRWLQLKRQVRHGEHGIAVLAPCPYKGKDAKTGEEKTNLFFKIAYVFDVSQTDGDPLPPTPEWTSPERILELENKLVEYANTLGLHVDRVEDLDGAQGSLDHSKNEIQLLATAGTKTLIHELAHHLLKHKGGQRSYQELEAEAVGYAVANHFGLPSAGSPNYIALSGGTGDEIKAHMEVIAQTTTEIIKAVEIQAISEIQSEEI